MFNPTKNYQINKFVPTENDVSFRKQLIQGYVHDETAAIMGGISGNAGLFGSANDVGKISELLLNKVSENIKNYDNIYINYSYTLQNIEEDINKIKI